MIDTALVQQAINSFARITGGWAKSFDQDNHHRKITKLSDVLIELGIGVARYKLKGNAIAKPLLGLLKQQMESTGAEVLITQYVPEKLAETLRDLRINYLDAAGNVYIQTDQWFILVQGQKKKVYLK